MKNVQKLTTLGILVAVGVACSPFFIPMGVAKCFPVQHMINVIASVTLGPVYAVAAAFLTSLFRVLSGTGTLLAFPGSMIGALCCGLMFKYTKKLYLAYIGEVVGTGILGALAAFPVATLVMSKDVALFAYVIPFMVSTAVGAAIAVVLIKALAKTNFLRTYALSNGTKTDGKNL